jgi:hypothetical protein
MALGLFKKTPREKPVEAPIAARVSVIPDSFYGGANPIVYGDTPQQKEVSVVPQTIPVGEAVPVLPPKPVVARRADLKAALDTQEGTAEATTSADMMDIPEEGKSHKLFLWIGVGLTVLLLGGVSFWYVTRTVDPTDGTIVVTPPPTFEPLPVPVTPVIVPEPAPISTTTPDVTIPTSTSGASLNIPPLSFLLDSDDVDKDGLTDIEEEIFETDSGTFDTDGDGYFDGQEVMNLYNPGGFAPVKIIESGLVLQYSNPVRSWQVYYPKLWDVGVVDASSTQILFSAITGDFIEIRESEKLPNETFEQWFSRVATNQRFGELLRKTNRFMVPIYTRQDGMVGYIEDQNRVYVMMYRQGSASVVLYRHVMDMMMQSFRPAPTVISTPEQPVIPSASSST